MSTNPLTGIYEVLQVGVHEPPIRFAVEVDQIQYRIFSYFPVGKDDSIAVQSYFKETHTFSKTIRVPPEDLTSEERQINIGSAKDAAHPFITEKDSFHQSGVLNQKDRLGQRLPGQDDIQSIPFDKIDPTIRLCYLCPTLYDRYPMVEPGAKKHHNVFRLVEDISKMPSIIELRLHKTDYDLVGKLTESYPGFAAFVDTNTLNARGLTLLTVFRKSPNPHFLSSPAFVKEFY